jgi:hypothetical protein
LKRVPRAIGAFSAGLEGIPSGGSYSLLFTASGDPVTQRAPFVIG